MNSFVTYVRHLITGDDRVVQLGQMVRTHVTWQPQKAGIAQAFDFVMMRRKGLRRPERSLGAHREDGARIPQGAKRRPHRGLEARAFEVNDVNSIAIAIMCEYVTTWYKLDGLSIAAAAASSNPSRAHSSRCERTCQGRRWRATKPEKRGGPEAGTAFFSDMNVSDAAGRPRAVTG
ncbi:hypothetical protein AB0436_29910 [Streptomyces sp. NPDC051322]|uniref:hypothetical protein n=1 Tax=Streptomyces sp. NPDC051322 TaxID=3154645 RepID=UPI00344CB442